MPPTASLAARLATLVAAGSLAAACGAPSSAALAPMPASAAAPPTNAPDTAGRRTVVTRTAAIVRRPIGRLRAGDIRPDTLSRVADRVAAIVAEPAALRVAVGDTIRLDDAIRVAAVDDAGARVGGLAIFDYALQPGAAMLVHDADGRTGIVGRSPGVATLRIHFPRYAWQGDGDARPALDVRVTVEPGAR